jgi:hypothetical protein
MEQSDKRAVLDRWREHLKAVSGEELDSELAAMPKDILSELLSDPELGMRLSTAINKVKAKEGQPQLESADKVTVPQPKAIVEKVGEVEITEQDEEDAEALRAHTESPASRARRESEEKGCKEEEKKLSMLAQISRMDIGAKAKLAREGGQDARSILIKEGNKIVSLAVLANPKMTIQEIEIVCASRNISEEVLREVSKNRDWMKSYGVKLALANNPKTPVGIGLTLIKHLTKRDLKFLAKSKGVPDAVRVAAKKLFVQKSRI